MRKNTEKRPANTFEQRQRRRNQVIFIVFSAVLILSMMLALVKF